MHVLITGGAGFIASHLVELHLARGDKVHVVDDLSTGSRDNLAPFENDSNLHFDHADLVEWQGLARAAAWADRIYHLAAVVGVYRVLAEPCKVMAVNVAGCERLLRAVAASAWRPSVVIASSSEVYGQGHNEALHEDLDIRIESGKGTRWNYAISKAADEALGISFARQYDIPVTLVRLFNTVGPRQTGRYGMVLPRFVQQAVDGEPMTVYGDGSQTRCFCDVRDTAQYLDRLAASSPVEGRVLNVGNVQEISIMGLARLVKERADSESEIVTVPYQEAYGQAYDDILRRRPCLERLHAATDYRPQYTLNQTIDELIVARRQHRVAA